MQAVKYLHFKGEVWPIHEESEGVWRDENGTYYALKDDQATLDPVDRCGVAPFALPPGDPATAACRGHDLMYSSPVYQLFNTREDADAYLRDTMKRIPGRSFLAWPFWAICRAFGGRFWENKATND